MSDTTGSETTMRILPCLLAAALLALLPGCPSPSAADPAAPDAGAPEVPAEAAATAAEQAPAHEIATFAVPDLGPDAGKQLALAVDPVDGVVSARTDDQAGTFAVTFVPGKTDPAAILTQVQTVTPQATLQGVAPAGDAKAKSGCGGCPSKSKCPKSQGKAETSG